MLRMLNRYRAALGVEALPGELEAAARRTEDHLRASTARLTVQRADYIDGELAITLRVENLAGHKLPTGYPSRRTWIYLSIRDSGGVPVFESGRLEPSGAISGNDNDEDAERYEPHYERITREDQVQIYESMMADVQNRVTTGLLSAVSYVKDNRLLPNGFDKMSASEDIAVRGDGAADMDFKGREDLVHYRISVRGREGPFAGQASLWFQPIGYRWAQNLRSYEAFETNRFVEFYESMSDDSGIELASQAFVVQRP